MRFFADPKHAAHEANVFWHPNETAFVIILGPRRDRGGVEAFAIDDWLMSLPSRRAADGTHVLLKDGKHRYQFLLTTPPKRGVVRVVVMPLDITTPYRGHVTHKFWDYASRGHPRPRFTAASRLDRLNMALRALDLRLAGGTYRSIAEGLLGPLRADQAPWKTAATRDTVIRLVRTGFIHDARRLSQVAGSERRSRVEAVPEHGMATIRDADVLIWAASQIVEARDAGLQTSRLMAATSYEILTSIGRGTSARDYHRLKAALDRLRATTVATSLRQSKERRLHRFSWINGSTERADTHGHPDGIDLIVPDWLVMSQFE